MRIAQEKQDLDEMPIQTTSSLDDEPPFKINEAL
jgi:hypothetical protein